MAVLIICDATQSACIYSPSPWYIGHISQTPEVPYCYYKQVANVIRSVKIQVLSFPCYMSYTPLLSANQRSGLEPPSL
jgi:hypothetical protein